MKKGHIFLLFIIFFICSSAKACQCPVTTLSLEECGKYEVIFRGKIDSVRNCNNNLGEAFFVIEDLYKGNATKHFKILFECGGPCDMTFNVGEEWIIYSRYKQITNAKMDWCSRSRKWFRIEKQDFYTVNYGNTYEEEVNFLKTKLGLHRLISESKNATEGRNIRPTATQTIIILICSLGSVFLFYWLFNRYYRKYNKR
jgi:hypothetical protein